MYTLWSELRSNSLVLSDCQYGCNVWSVPIIPSTFIPCRAITVKNMCIRFEVHAHYVYTSYVMHTMTPISRVHFEYIFENPCYAMLFFGVDFIFFCGPNV